VEALEEVIGFSEILVDLGEEEVLDQEAQELLETLAAIHRPKDNLEERVLYLMKKREEVVAELFQLEEMLQEQSEEQEEN
jgi:hypothetical protein